MCGERNLQVKRALVAGWFSFKGGGTTAGDLMARDLACEWLTKAGYVYDIAAVSPFNEPIVATGKRGSRRKNLSLRGLLDRFKQVFRLGTRKPRLSLFRSRMSRRYRAEGNPPTRVEPVAESRADQTNTQDIAKKRRKTSIYGSHKERLPNSATASVGAAPAMFVDWRVADPDDYSLVVFVCGPFAQREWETQFISHFAGCRLAGLDLSMLTHLDQWNPFDLLFERHSSERASADIVFLSQVDTPPVAGVCLVETYPGALVPVANEAIKDLITCREMSIIKIDTRLEVNETGLRTCGEIEALIARVDVLITTRLHGIVLAIKNGIPVLAIDPLGDGRKLLRQCEAIGWPIVFPADELSQERLVEALDYCLTDSARAQARACARKAIRMVEATRDSFIREIGS